MTLALLGAGLASGGAVAFTPASLTSLTAWYDPTTLALADSAAVSSWSDSSGNGNTITQASGSNQPLLRTAGIGTAKSVQFDGTDDMLSTAAAALDNLKPFSLACAVKVTDFTTYRTIFYASNGIHIRANQTTGAIEFDKGGAAGIGTSSSSLTAATPAVLVVTYDGSGNYAFYINGTAAGSGLSNQTFTGAATAFIGRAASTQPFIGQLGDLILTNAVFTSGERTSVTSWLGTRYGITVS